MISNRQIKIAELLSRASNESAPLEQRLRNIEKLVRMRGGLGRPSRKAIRIILSAARLVLDGQLKRSEIDEPIFQGLVDRIDALEDRSAEVAANRRARIETTQIHKKILAAKLAEVTNHPPTAPFTVPPAFATRYKWRYRVNESGDLEWQLNQN